MSKFLSGLTIRCRLMILNSIIVFGMLAITIASNIQINKMENIIKKQQDVITSNSKLVNQEYKIPSSNIIYIITFIVIIIGSILSKIINDTMVIPLLSMKKYLNEFSDLINFKRNVLTPINDYGRKNLTEQMKGSINDSIEIFDSRLKDDMKVIGEMVLTADKIKRGSYQCRIKSNSSNPQIATLVRVFNSMLDSVESNIVEVLTTLNSYTNNNYTVRINSTDKYINEMKELTDSVNKLGITLKNSAKSDLSNGVALEGGADSLLSSVKILSDSANKQADNLEKTAIATKNITINIKQTSEKAIEMSDIAKDVKKSAEDGNILADKTLIAMDSINNSTNDITEAIGVIDQIAFQTNILSLNAAVEAATAGETGKGFAVVAQEVRNLASRSAEAASEIKALVVEAKEKANEGKNISTLMTNSFNNLNEKVTINVNLIEDVTKASTEQMNGMQQINNSISELDLTTQNNAKLASEVKEIATDMAEMAVSLVEDAKSKKV